MALKSNKKLLGTSASLLVTSALVAPGHTTRSKDATNGAPAVRSPQMRLAVESSLEPHSSLREDLPSTLLSGLLRVDTLHIAIHGFCFTVVFV